MSNVYVKEGSFQIIKDDVYFLGIIHFKGGDYTIVQAVINCRAGGSCEGGNPAAVYEFAAEVGVPDVTCMVYEAVDQGPISDCTKPDIDLCRDCTWPPPALGEKPNCWAKKQFKRWANKRKYYNHT